MLESLGVTGVTFAGFIAEAELADHYAKATVMVFPSHYGFGLSTLEAMACGTPVVGVAALDAPEFFADAGVLAEPDNAEDLAACLTRVLTQPALQQDLSKRASARAALFPGPGPHAKTSACMKRSPGARVPRREWLLVAERAASSLGSLFGESGAWPVLTAYGLNVATNTAVQVSNPSARLLMNSTDSLRRRPDAASSISTSGEKR